mgnify:CR=1 FL=1
MVYSKDDYDKRRLKNYHDLANFILKETIRIEPKKTIKHLVISDSIILSMPIEAEERDFEKLRNFFLAVNLVQFHLAKNQILTRGGISYGGVKFEPENNLLFGPGYIEAYLLESKLAKYPRTIVDMKVVRSFGFETPQQFVNEINRRDTGGITYTNWNADIIFDWNRHTDARSGFVKDYPLFLDWTSNVLKNCLIAGADVEIDNLLICLKKHIVKRNDAFDKIRWLIDYLIVKISGTVFNEAESKEQHDHLMAYEEALKNI